MFFWWFRSKVLDSSLASLFITFPHIPLSKPTWLSFQIYLDSKHLSLLSVLPLSFRDQHTVFEKGHIVNIFCLTGHTVIVATTHLCCYNANGHNCVPIKVYLRKSNKLNLDHSHSLLTPDCLVSLFPSTVIFSQVKKRSCHLSAQNSAMVPLLDQSKNPFHNLQDPT